MRASSFTARARRILLPLRRLLDGVRELLAADATDELAAPLLACGRTAAQFPGNFSVNCVKAQALPGRRVRR